MKIDHVAILVDDLDISEKWYQENCGAILTFKDHKYRRMKMQNTTIALISKHHYEHAHIGLLVSEYGHLPSGKGKVIHHRDGTTGCYVMDPDGNMVEFIYYNDDCKKKLGIEE
jgi:catechol 2,3-dioxygenase-like lactoylglutathione lyase family enzyme